MGEAKKIDMKKLMIGLLVTVTLVATIFAGCVTEETASTEIVVISRELTSGTREFFWEHVLGKANFSEDAIEKTSNGEVHDTVSTTPLAIGYIGLGYLDDEVKALKIDGVTPSVDTVLDGTYPISRDLYMFTKDNASGLAKDFIDYILSTEGQEIVAEEGFVPLPDTEEFNTTGRATTGTLDISGSTTVFPIAVAAQEAYNVLFPDVTININAPGSGAGIAAVGNSGNTGIEIGMASRDLKDSEQGLGLVKYTICSDGIAVIVHTSNTYVDNDSLTMAQLKSIFIGEISDWADL